MLSICQKAFTLAKLIYCLAIPAYERFVRDRISDFARYLRQALHYYSDRVV